LKKLIREQNVNDITDLVCVGMHGWGVEKMYESYAQDKQLQKHMFFYTDVSDSELNELYSKCTFTLFPSHVEGWGLGAVESLLYKKVSVISTCEALSEATQGLMPSIDPYDTDAWAEMVMKLSLDKVFRNELEQKISDEFKIRHWNEFCRDFFSYAGGDE
jgi:glycosyltransferase involved in cell wall biosynthesis